MAAELLKRPYLKISPEESKRLATSLTNVLKQYKIEFNPALVAWFALLGTGAAIYGPRIGIEIALQKALAEQRRQEKSLRTAGTQPTNKMGVAPVSQVAPESDALTAQPVRMNFGS